MVTALAGALLRHTDEAMGLDESQWRCVAQGFVDKFGVQGLVGMGLLDGSLTPVSEARPMTADQASTAADAMLECVDAQDFVYSIYGGANMSQPVFECVTGLLGDQGVHDLLAANLSADWTKTPTILAPVMKVCNPGPSPSR